LQAGVVHRDLKPANVLFKSETGRETGRRDALKVPRGTAKTFLFGCLGPSQMDLKRLMRERMKAPWVRRATVA
jgi:serine/threonine protein kinase